MSTNEKDMPHFKCEPIGSIGCNENYVNKVRAIGVIIAPPDSLQGLADLSYCLMDDLKKNHATALIALKDYEDAIRESEIRIVQMDDLKDRLIKHVDMSLQTREDVMITNSGLVARSTAALQCPEAELTASEVKDFKPKPNYITGKKLPHKRKK